MNRARLFPTSPIFLGNFENQPKRAALNFLCATGDLYGAFYPQSEPASHGAEGRLHGTIYVGNPGSGGLINVHKWANVNDTSSNFTSQLRFAHSDLLILVAQYDSYKNSFGIRNGDTLSNCLQKTFLQALFSANTVKNTLPGVFESVFEIEPGHWGGRHPWAKNFSDKVTRPRGQCPP
ncbi:hypothetical protein K438DRAFT_1751202 [Mycena galopus ATCC 62051]|nr:hypothetical protein K438DRAFT_1751202 [Mycena galopus ATCC 62051]